jgi:hypothetical protein
MMCYNVPPPPPSYYEEIVSSYRDQYGLIVQQDKDGGDASHRIGVYYYGLHLIYKDDATSQKEVKEKFNKDLDKIKIGPGQFVRHPDPKKWYSDPRNFTRDQTTPLVIAMGAFDRKDDLWSNFKNLVKNWGFYPNDLKNWTNEPKSLPFDYNDIAGIADYGTYIRSFKAYAFYPYLLFSDVSLLGNSLVRTFFSYFDKTDSSDDLLFTLLLLQSDEVMPTPFSKMSKFIYTYAKAKVLPPINGYKSDLPIQTSWDYYFRKEATAPPLDDVYRCVIEKAFYKHDRHINTNSIVQK